MNENGSICKSAIVSLDTLIKKPTHYSARKTSAGCDVIFIKQSWRWRKLVLIISRYLHLSCDQISKFFFGKKSGVEQQLFKKNFSIFIRLNQSKTAHWLTVCL